MEFPCHKTFGIFVLAELSGQVFFNGETQQVRYKMRCWVSSRLWPAILKPSMPHLSYHSPTLRNSVGSYIKKEEAEKPCTLTGTSFPEARIPAIFFPIGIVLFLPVSHSSERRLRRRRGVYNADADLLSSNNTIVSNSLISLISLKYFTSINYF